MYLYTYYSSSSQVDYNGMARAWDRIGALKMLIFGIRTVMLFAGVILIWRAIVLLWELRPVRKKKYDRVFDGTVIELTEEHRSASLNTYYLPRIEYLDENGEKQIFAPKAYRPCRLKYGDEVTLCLAKKKKKEKFRTIRKKTSNQKAGCYACNRNCANCFTAVLKQSYFVQFLRYEMRKMHNCVECL